MIGGAVSGMDTLRRIEELRNARGWSNYRLAKEADIPENSLSSLFRRNYLPSIPTLTYICAGLGVTLSQFFAGEGEAVVLDEKQQELLDVWSTLPEKEQDLILHLLIQI